MISKTIGNKIGEIVSLSKKILLKKYTSIMKRVKFCTNYKKNLQLTYIRNSEYQELHQAMNKLPKSQKRRIILRYFHGMTLQQIADLEKVNINAIRKSIDSALYKLKKLSNDFLI